MGILKGKRARIEANGYVACSFLLPHPPSHPYYKMRER